MIYLFVYTFSRTVLGKTSEVEIIASTALPELDTNLSLLSDLVLPTKWPSHAWGCAKGVSGVSCPEQPLPLAPFQACWPYSFWTLLELVRTLPIATNRKMHELANPKGEFIIRRRGCFMHFKGWEAARLQRLELQIVRLSLGFLCCFLWDFSFIFFLFLYEISSSMGSMWQTNKQIHKKAKQMQNKRK